jgi:hypothetical protein
MDENNSYGTQTVKQIELTLSSLFNESSAIYMFTYQVTIKGATVHIF